MQGYMIFVRYIFKYFKEIDQDTSHLGRVKIDQDVMEIINNLIRPEFEDEDVLDRISGGYSSFSPNSSLRKPSRRHVFVKGRVSDALASDRSANDQSSGVDTVANRIRFEMPSAHFSEHRPSHRPSQTIENPRIRIIVDKCDDNSANNTSNENNSSPTNTNISS